MKKVFASGLIIYLFFSFGHLVAQDCGVYFSSQKGMKIEMVSYDKKDKATAIIKYELIDVKPVADGTALTFSNETYDTKGKLLAKGESTGKCVGSDYYTDIRNLNSEMIPKSADIKMSVTGEQLIYPANLAVGDQLKDASLNVKSGFEGGLTIMNLTANIVDRKVEGFETVETPAGKFDCVKITYTMNMKFMGNRTIKGVEYLAKGIGVVKTEQFDDKDKKVSSLLVTKIEK